jgi:HAD superfamily hydrolase (TIGR01509 family)
VTVPRLVIFDCDGVLVDTERLTIVVEARVLTDLGWPITEAEVVERWMGKSSATQLADLDAHLGAEGTRLFDERTTAELHETFDRELTAIDGVEVLLDRLEAAGIPTCVASSGTHERMRRTLGLTGLHDRFGGRIFSAVEVPHGKPAPDLFLHAAQRMGVTPADCVVIEDSVYGVQAAVAAGMTVYGFAGGLTAGSALSEAGAVVFDRMHDLVEVLTGEESSTSTG